MEYFVYTNTNNFSIPIMDCIRFGVIKSGRSCYLTSGDDVASVPNESVVVVEGKAGKSGVEVDLEGGAQQ